MPLLFRKTPSQPSMSSSQKDVALVPVEDIPLSRRPYGFGGPMQDLEGLVYTTEGIFLQIIPNRARHSSPDVGAADNLQAVHVPLGEESDDDHREDPDAEKKQRQWLRWSREVIPAMIQPYLSLLHKSLNLSNLANFRNDVGCIGCDMGRRLAVSCIYFERKPLNNLYGSFVYCAYVGIEKIILCTCKSPALQLLSRGVFPCAPLEPSLAVDLNMLDFVQSLFVHAAPNITAWCDTLESFLSARNFKLTTRVCFLFTFIEQLSFSL